MENKWKKIDANLGWKEYAFNENENRLYLQSYLSSTIDIVENFTSKDYEILEKVIKENNREKIENFFKKKELENGINIAETTIFLIKEGSYSIPKDFFINLNKNIINKIIKNENYLALKKLSFSKKRKFIKEKVNNLKND